MGSRRKSNIADSSSLELLLDTITNSFGGVLLIAILVVVRLQNTTDDFKHQSGYDEFDITEMRLTLQNLEAEKEMLKEERRISGKIFDGLIDPELGAALNELAGLKSRLSNKKQRESEVATEINDLKQNFDKIKRELGQLESDLRDESKAVDQLKGELESERQRRTIQARFPEERSTTKTAFNLTVRYGRWYVDISPSGRPNLEEFSVVDNGEYLTISPKPYRGKPIIAGNRLSKEVLYELTQINAQFEYICVAIWDDSFDEFQLLRDHLVSHGFAYRVIPLTDGDVVTYGAVTDAQVQ